MKKNLYVGVMGYSAQKFDIEKAKELLNDAFDRISLENPDKDIFIVSGYTNLGIPGLAYSEAVKRGWKTFGIACKKALDYDVFPCDEKIIIGENWGDESSTFLSQCEIFVRVGGGNQSRREAAVAIDECKFVIEYDLPAIPS
jgi:hypothetical protein